MNQEEGALLLISQLPNPQSFLSRAGNIDSASQWEKYQNYIVRSNGMGAQAAAIFEKYTFPLLFREKRRIY